MAVINAMKSSRPTGIGMAGDAVAGLLPEGMSLTSARLDRWFVRINDARLPVALRGLIRLGLAQCAPRFFPRGCELLFTSHHAPLWPTGRHTIIIHDLIALRNRQQSPSQWRFYKSILPRVVRSATRVVTVSRSVRDELAAAFPATAAARATVIPSFSVTLGKGIESGQPFPARRDARQFLVVGARYQHKNLGIVLQAFEKMRNISGPLPRLVVAGCRREIWPALPALERTGRVTVLTRATAAEIEALYCESISLLFPSTAEGQGLPPLEAFVHGCAVIASDTVVLRETCGDAAFYIDPGDATALAELMTDLVEGRLDAEVERRRGVACLQLNLYSQQRLQSLWANFLEEIA